MPEPTPSPTEYPFKVAYFSAKHSRKGAGVRVRFFRTRAEAETFAGENRIYSGPCRVELREGAVEPARAERDCIATLAALPGVDADAVWNFLGTLDGLTQSEALANLEIEARTSGWNTQTGRAIQAGIMRAGFLGEVRS